MQKSVYAMIPFGTVTHQASLAAILTHPSNSPRTRRNMIQGSLSTGVPPRPLCWERGEKNSGGPLRPPPLLRPTSTPSCNVARLELLRGRGVCVTALTPKAGLREKIGSGAGLKPSEAPEDPEAPARWGRLV